MLVPSQGVSYVACRNTGHTSAVALRNDGDEVFLVHALHHVPARGIQTPAHEVWPVGPWLIGAFRCAECGATNLAVCLDCNRLSCVRGDDAGARCGWGCGLGALRTSSGEAVDLVKVWADV